MATMGYLESRGLAPTQEEWQEDCKCIEPGKMLIIPGWDDKKNVCEVTDWQVKE